MEPSFNAAIQANILRAYGAWSAGMQDILRDGRTTRETLVRILEEAERAIPARTCRLFPSAFSPDDPQLAAFPRPIDWKWRSLENALRFFGARSVMMRLPYFWQLESPMHAACRSAHAPILINQLENIPVGVAAISSGTVDTVVTTADDASAFASALFDRKVAPAQFWFLVHRADMPARQIPAPLQTPSITVVQEVHLFPGVPILEQCPELAARKDAAFHLSDAYAWEFEENASLITSLGDDPLPLYRYEIPGTIETVGACSCGKPIVTRRV